MFENVGRKIRNWAKLLFYINAIITVVSGITFIVQHPLSRNSGGVDVLIGFAIIIFGLLFSWFISLLVYAYGENNENLKRTAGVNVDANNDYKSAPVNK